MGSCLRERVIQLLSQVHSRGSWKPRHGCPPADNLGNSWYSFLLRSCTVVRQVCRLRVRWLRWPASRLTQLA